MGMSTHVVGIREPNEKWRQMKAVWDACEVAKIAPPPEVDEFFDSEPPDPAGVVLDLDYGPHNIARKWTDGDHREGTEITLAELPPNITKIRFFNSY